MKKFLSLLIILITLCTFFSCNAKDEGMIFGTIYDFNLTGSNSAKANKEMLKALENIEKTISTTVETSDVYKLNHAKANEILKVSPLVIELYKESIKVNKLSNKAYNPAIFPIVSLWGFNPNGNFKIPSEDEITETLKYSNMDNFHINPFQNTLQKSYTENQIDFGSIGKGYAVGECLKIAEKYKLSKAVINIGGTVSVYNSSIVVGIQHPRKSFDVLGSFKLNSKEVVSTSGDYEKFVIEENVRYHHIFAKDGKPVKNGVVSTVVVSTNPALADVYSTTLMILGVEEGIKFAKENNIKCLIICEDKTIKSNDFPIDLIDNSYKVL